MLAENTHTAIIDKDIFDKAQFFQRCDTRTPPKKSEVYLFSGFVKCADCKKSMHRRTSKNLVYYACRTYTEKSKERCSKHTIRLDAMENAVLRAIKSQIALVGNISEILGKVSNTSVVESQHSHYNKMLKARKKEFDKLISLLDSLYIDWKNDDISKDQYKRMSTRIELQIRDLNSAIENIINEQHQLDIGTNSQKSVLELFIKHKNIESLNREILGELVDTIYVHEGGRLTIVFNFCSPMLLGIN